MSSWVKIRGGILIKYSDGTHNQPADDGWVEVTYPAKHWKLLDGELVKKTLEEIESEISPDIIEAELIRQHKIHTMSMVEIEAWVDSNVNDLADVKRVLVLLVKLVRAQQRWTHRKK